MKTILILFIPFSLFLQSDINSRYQLQKISVNEIESVEKEYKSKKIKSDVEVSLSKQYYPYFGNYLFEQPLQYRRQGEKGIDCGINYFFDEKSKEVKLIDYTWAKTTFIYNIFEIQKELKNEHKNFEYYNAKFDEIFSELTSTLGKPTDGNGQLIKSDNSDGEIWERNSKWIIDDRTVNLNMIFTPKGWNGFLGTYRVRLKIYWN